MVTIYQQSYAKKEGGPYMDTYVPANCVADALLAECERLGWNMEKVIYAASSYGNVIRWKRLQSLVRTNWEWIPNYACQIYAVTEQPKNTVCIGCALGFWQPRSI